MQLFITFFKFFSQLKGKRSQLEGGGGASKLGGHWRYVWVYFFWFCTKILVSPFLHQFGFLVVCKCSNEDHLGP